MGRRREGLARRAPGHVVPRTPANHYPSRLPEFGDAPVVKLVTPRLAPARIGEYLIALPAGGGTGEPVAPGFETFLYGLDGEASALSTGASSRSAPARGPTCPRRRRGRSAAGDAPARLLMVKRRYEPWPGLDAPACSHGHRDDEPLADTPVPGFRRRELLPVDDPAFDFAMRLLRSTPASASTTSRSTTRSTAST